MPKNTLAACVKGTLVASRSRWGYHWTSHRASCDSWQDFQAPVGRRMGYFTRSENELGSNKSWNWRNGKQRHEEEKLLGLPEVIPSWESHDQLHQYPSCLILKRINISMYSCLYIHCVLWWGDSMCCHAWGNNEDCKYLRLAKAFGLLLAEDLCQARVA